MKRPLVGVTGPVVARGLAWQATRRAIERAGGIAVRLTAEDAAGAPLDALVLGGGTDVDPHRYGAQRDPRRRYDPARDAFELELLARADARRTPVLGICRGAQLLNVARGGTLTEVRALTGRPATRRWLPTRRVRLIPAGRLARTTLRTVLRVNALHQQCIERIGTGLAVSAVAQAVVQAIESREERFVLGVQWHPEYISTLPAQARIFRALVHAA